MNVSIQLINENVSKKTFPLVIFKMILVFRDFKSGRYKRTELKRHKNQSYLEQKHTTGAKWSETCMQKTALVPS